MEEIKIARWNNGPYWPQVMLFGPRGPNDPLVATLAFPASAEPWKQVRDGSRVKVRATIHHDGATFWNCHFTVIEGEPTPEVSIAELTKAFQTDPSEAEKKFARRMILVRGKLTKPVVFRELPSDVEGILTAADGSTLTIFGHEYDHTDVEKLKVGQEVLLLGVCEFKEYEKPPRVGLKTASVPGFVKAP